MTAADIGHQPLVAGHVLAQQHQALFDRGQCIEAGLDLAELDAEAAQLDLVVDAAEELDGAVGAAAGQVAGAVQAVRRIAARRGRG